ncbi:hypothetical protein JX265_002726 [Neoarthrinium moseri]|uniref:N-acetyltransferase domain-containing protein n=1 Tax=Neoarthrinium moseri TaxID=1658444 RepID=A0A9P9WUZ1_9PEZI|nr:uncharacterized protein JN550_000537 [Neoarthrinium moseri]KAI1842668.1 hypothetical protein JX266_011130 [Neoarthrinium moseri]KAI1878355.1 hypothetical protein JN550_000537 [Neoarthrinium moseri]KAI1879772.1 hypothetical protein JX265_002726 [Neoarthrinium moseri]
MSSDAQHLRIRSARSTGHDAQFVVAAWDSTLPYLASIGAGEMWGGQPFSQREGFEEEIKDVVLKSEEDDWNDSRRLLMAEVETPVDGTSNIVPVGAALIRDTLPYYLTERQELKSEIEKKRSLLFIEVIISDHRSQPRYRGTGAALVEAIKRRALEKGKDVVYLDAWAGNGRKLNRQVYYEGLGFRNVGDFHLTRNNGSTWPGTLYCIDINTSNAQVAEAGS